MKSLLKSIFTLLLVALSMSAFAQKGKDMAMIRTLYAKGFSATPESNATLQKYLADSFISASSNPGKGKQELIQMMQYIYQLVPNMKWEIRQIVRKKGHYAVRCEVTGNPVGNFMGVPTDGKKSFKIMTMHFLKVEKGQVVENFFVEDWASAIEQLKK
ncbi:MAG TPA: ester cyclase [Saprospiraceae bacterium]|nr:ester cyclase [Saprospiraceae bacterium]